VQRPSATERGLARVTELAAAEGNRGGCLQHQERDMATATHDANELKRKMQNTLAVLKQEFSGLRTGRASASLLDPVHVDAYGASMPLSQVATVSVPEPRLLSVSVWDRSLVHAVEKAITAANLGLNPQTEGQTIRLRIPELNEERRKELVKVAHKYAEAARVAIRHVRREGLDVVKKLEKDHAISKDDHERMAEEIQKITDQMIHDVDHLLAGKEKEILTV
jgi:ribosome recycling factor